MIGTARFIKFVEDLWQGWDETADDLRLDALNAWNAFGKERTAARLAQAETRCAREELVVLRNTVSWLQSRINQLELDKAQLLHRILNPSVPVPIAVPELVQERGGDPRLRPDIDQTGTVVSDLPDAPFVGAINWDDDPTLADPADGPALVGDGAPRS